MQLKRWTKRLIAGVAALVVVAAANVALAQPSQAAPCVNPHDASVSHGSNYKATFKHYGEVLIVEDHITDGLAAVAYVRVHRFMRCEGGEVPIWSNEPVDTDTFVMDHGYDEYNLGTPDGSGDIPEDYKVRIRICKGYASNPGDNCSDWKNGFA